MTEPQLPRYILIEVRGFQSGGPEVNKPVDLACQILRKAIHEVSGAWCINSGDLVVSAERRYYSGQAATADYKDLRIMFHRVMDWAKEYAERRRT